VIYIFLYIQGDESQLTKGVLPMKNKVAILLLLIFLVIFCIPVVTADQTNLLITKSKDFLVVDGDQATITVIVKDQATGNPIPGVRIDFSVNTEAHGTLNPMTEWTGSNGTATSVFTSNGVTGTTAVTVNAGLYGNWLGYLYIQGYPDTLNFTGTPQWLVAGDTANTSVISLLALNRSHPIPMLNVKYSVLGWEH
jgi:hypothetical protein